MKSHIAAGTIYIRNMRVRAYHGVLEQERVVGNDYVVSLKVDYPIEAACLSDDVTDTMNYAEAAEIIKKEMAQQSNLLENVAYRIGNAILTAFPLATKATVDLRKIAPPMPIDSDGAGVTIELSKN